MKSFVFLAYILICPLVLFSQMNLDEVKWKTWVEHEVPKLERCTSAEDRDGNIILICSNGRKGVTFTKIDPYTGNTILTQRRFKKIKGEINALLLTSKGVLLAGKSDQATLWFISNDANESEEIQPAFFKDIETFNDLKAGSDGTLHLTGQQNGKLLYMVLDANYQLVRPIFMDKNSSAGTGIVIDNITQSVYITGYRQAKKDQELLLIKFNAAGEWSWEKVFDETNILNAKLIYSDKEELVIAGTTALSFEFQEDIYITKLDKRGNIIWWRQSKKLPKEVVNSIIQLPDRHFLLTGYYQNPGLTNYPNTLLQLVDWETGEFLSNWEKDEPLADEGMGLIRLANDDIILTRIATPKNERKIQPHLTNFPYSTCEIRLSDDEPFYFAHAPIFYNEYFGNEWFELTGTLVSQVGLDETNLRIRSGFSSSKSGNTFYFDEKTSPHEGQYCYDLEKKIRLEPGVNNISIRVKKDEQIFKDSISVFHVPKRPNLHILSIGIYYDNLDYTENDARDFAALFQSQKGKLFKNIHSVVLDKKELTEAGNINEELFALKDRYEGKLANPIMPEDILILFISSHGDLNNEEDFILPGAYYRRENKRSYLHFKDEVISVLNQIQCKKLVFIDACKSGNAKSLDGATDPSLIENIVAILDTEPNLSIITSCSKTEESYESKVLQNGYFTEAITEALDSRSYETDYNNDKVITVKELYQFLQQRVPKLLSTYEPNTNKTQNPSMPRNELNENLPLFYLGRE